MKFYPRFLNLLTTTFILGAEVANRKIRREIIETLKTTDW
jgi:hypothetical protein